MRSWSRKLTAEMYVLLSTIRGIRCKHHAGKSLCVLWCQLCRHHLFFKRRIVKSLRVPPDIPAGIDKAVINYRACAASLLLPCNGREAYNLTPGTLGGADWRRPMASTSIITPDSNCVCWHLCNRFVKVPREIALTIARERPRRRYCSNGWIFISNGNQRGNKRINVLSRMTLATARALLAQMY